MLILILWLPASDHVAKQARTVHALTGREPSEQLALSYEYLPVFKNERTRAESSSYIKKTSNGNATHNFILISNNNCLSRFPF